MSTKPQYTDEQIEYFIQGYIAAMLFVTDDEHGTPLNQNFSQSDVDSDSYGDIRVDCMRFLERAGNRLDGADLEQCGMDFLYERNGHGVGFYDRGFIKADELYLSALAKEFGETSVWIECGEVCCE